MKIQSFEIENKILKEYIDCIFLIENDANENSNSFSILPSVSGYLSISKNTKTFFKKNEFITTFDATNTLDSSIHIGLPAPFLNKYVGSVKEICIRFKPLGLFHFFNEKEILATLKENLNFNPYPDYCAAMSKIAAMSDNKKMIREIENYLLGKLNDFEHPFLTNVLSKITTVEMDTKINFEQLSNEFNITRQTLNNHFNKYLRLSPIQFKQIYRFRKFVDLKLANKKEKKSINVLYEVGFFDQSHLIKFFKKSELQNPLNFFNQIYEDPNKRVLVLWQ